MNKSALGATAAAVVAAAALGYWAGARHVAPVVPAPVADGGKAITPFGEARKSERKLLYYRNPMGLPDTSPTPKKDSMGMDYVPVFEGDEDTGTGIKISTEKVQKLGVRTAKVEKRALDTVVRATGRVEIDERRLSTITAKYEGYVERLHVNATGQYVARGTPLFEAYSPELLAAQREYAVAMQGLASLKDADAQTQAGMKRLADSALARLRNWDVTDEDIARVAAGAEARRALTFRAPASGIVIERKATQGMRFMPGEMLYQIADLSSVWLIADVFEQDIGRVRVGQAVHVYFEAYPGERFSGRVTYIYPTLKAEMRAAQVRIELANPVGRLKPGMYAKVEMPEVSAGGGTVLAVPNSAVLDNGTRRVVLVDLGGGRFAPRDVKLGARGDEYVAIIDGVKEGEVVVVAANFLIDAESNLQAALGGMGSGGTAAPEKSATSHQGSGTLVDIDAKSGALLIAHEPVTTLGWPKMKMEFMPANDAIAKSVKPGTPITFEFVERKPGEWVVTKIEARK